MFEGGFREFRSEGNILKTEEEKKQMAEKHRVKEHREFKKRLDGSDDMDNEEDDIRSFQFRKSPYASSLQASFARKGADSGRDKGDRKSYGQRGKDDRRGGKSYGKDDRRGGGKPFGKGDRKGGKPYGKKFND